MLYLITVLNGEKRIDFPHFEARVYWQVSICIFYLLLSFYYYFNKTSDKIYIYILFSVISLLTYFFLTFFTERKNDNWDRLWIYMIYLYLEIVFSMITLFLLKIEFNREQLEIIDDGKLEWRINKIDTIKYLIPIFPLLIWNNLKEFYSKSRFCEK